MAPCIVEMPPGSDFPRFCLVAQKLGSALRTTFYSFLLLLGEESNEREGRAPKLEKAETDHPDLFVRLGPGRMDVAAGYMWFPERTL